MKLEAILLLKNLLARLDADVRTQRPQFLGVVSDGERDALRLLLEDAGSSRLGSTAEPARPLGEEIAPPAPTIPAELTTDALRLTASPKPRWTLCLDFGTAKSKAFAATDEEEPSLEPLPIGNADEDLDRSVHEVSSSIWIDDDGLLFVGSMAVMKGMNYGDQSATNRRRLDSLKQEISQVLSNQGPGQLERKLPVAVDPTSTLTYRDAVTAYLAYLTDLATTELESRIGTRYVRRRFTLPWWPKDQRQWVGSLITNSLMRAQVLADTFHGAWRNGIHVERLKRALVDVADHDAQLAWLLEAAPRDGVLEALAAASARVWRDRGEVREMMLVVDVGAGTTDFSLFLVSQSEERGFRRALPIQPCGAAIKQAGDILDSLLVAELVQRADLGEDRALRQRVSDSLYRGGVRQLKETLFQTGEITKVLVSDHTVTLSKEEFIESDGIRKFEERISNRIQELLDGVHESWATVVQDRGITLVLTGGGCSLPMIRSLADKRWKLGEQTIGCRLAPDVPESVADTFSREFIREYPKLAVAMGGAMQVRLDERDALSDWKGGAPPVGRLERFATGGA